MLHSKNSYLLSLLPNVTGRTLTPKKKTETLVSSVIHIVSATADGC